MPDENNIDPGNVDIAGPTPPDLRRGPGAVGPDGEVAIIDQLSNYILSGPWVTSHAGFLQNTQAILDPFAPPQTAGFDVSYAADGVPNAFQQREGFFHTAAVTLYVFDGAGGLTGYMEHVRGGHRQHSQVAIIGTYEAFRRVVGAGHRLYWGRIYTELPVGRWNYYFVMKNMWELEWVWTPPPQDPPPANKHKQPRPLIARGTLTKVRTGGWLRRSIQRLILV